MNKDDLEKANDEYLKKMGYEPETESKSKNDELKKYEEEYLDRLSKPKKEEILEILSSVVNRKEHKKTVMRKKFSKNCKMNLYLYSMFFIKEFFSNHFFAVVR